MLEQSHGRSSMNSHSFTCSVEAMYDRQNRYRIRRLEHSRLHVHTPTLGPFFKFSQYIAILFRGSNHQTVVPVIEGYGEVRTHRLECLYSSCFLIISIDFVVIEVVFVESAFPTHRFIRVRWFGREGDLFFFGFLCFSLVDEREEARHIPIRDDGEEACSSWMARATL